MKTTIKGIKLIERYKQLQRGKRVTLPLMTTFFNGKQPIIWKNLNNGHTVSKIKVDGSILVVEDKLNKA